MDDAPGSDDDRAIRHVNKRARKAKGAVAVFDENARREFVTGFRKRKQQRRKQAEKENIEKERRKRIQIRKERRLAHQETLAEAAKTAQLATTGRVGMEDEAGELAEEDEPTSGPALEDVVVYDDAAAVTTVVIKDIGSEAIDDEKGNSGDDELLQYGKARLKERNKKVVNSGQVLKRDIKKRLAHKANNKKGHNKKSKNSNSKQKSKKKGR